MARFTPSKTMCSPPLRTPKRQSAPPLVLENDENVPLQNQFVHSLKSPNEERPPWNNDFHLVQQQKQTPNRTPMDQGTPIPQKKQFQKPMNPLRSTDLPKSLEKSKECSDEFQSLSKYMSHLSVDFKAKDAQITSLNKEIAALKKENATLKQEALKKKDDIQDKQVEWVETLRKETEYRYLVF